MYRGGGLIILLSATHADSLIKPGGKKPIEDHYDTVRKTTLCLSMNIHGLKIYIYSKPRTLFIIITFILSTYFSNSVRRVLGF